MGDELLAALAAPLDEMTAAVGFANASGVRHVADHMVAARARGALMRLLVGIDGTITSAPGLRALLRLVDELWVFRHPARPLFHPKTYLFRSAEEGVGMVGSANLTESALWVNYEDVVVLDFDLTDDADQQAFEELRRSFDAAIASPNARLADEGLLDALEGVGLLPSEARMRRRGRRRSDAASRALVHEGLPDLFPPTAAAPPPAASLLPEEVADVQANPAPVPPDVGEAPPEPPSQARYRVFVMRLGHRDAGTRPGFSPDVYIPLAAFHADPEFWGHFIRHETDAGYEYFERYPAIEFRRLNGDIDTASRRLYQYPRRAEFRLNSSEIHHDSDEGDLLRLELAEPGLGVEYHAQVIKPTDALYDEHLAIAANEVAASVKRWGFR